ncbi:hypothetical protein AG1IA_02697 [Rhizoctonia solani AG-1 IA]|uniref:Uncharacterized protein n=1 Tax=Thanatephorus cucumeris (strain AG1-IA) TaxID=983506 RepID=L8X3Q1_THACA|nr:hypothetical protein AG1IA_02697 [Rhizoctonia solani AG-1 IA]
MTAVPQRLVRTDTRLDLAIDIKYGPLSITLRANGPALFPFVDDIERRRPLKRTESFGKGGNALIPAISMHESLLAPKVPSRFCRDRIGPANIPVFSPVHEVTDNVGPDFGKWHLM